MKSRMKKILYLISIIAFLSCGNTSRIFDADIIDISGAIEYGNNSINLSEFADSITYIPLEMTEGSIVGACPNVRVTKNYIIVDDYQSNGDGSLKLFDRTGKFIRKVGHFGRDPQGYSDWDYNGWMMKVFWVDDFDECIYFGKMDGARSDALASGPLVKYGFDGTFKGTISLSQGLFPISPDECHLAFTREKIFVYNLYSYDSIPRVYSINKKNNNIKIEFFGDTEYRSPNYKKTNSRPPARTGYKFKWNCCWVVYYYKDEENGETYIGNFDAPSLYTLNGKCYIKENFNDTIFSIENGKKSPYKIINLGKWNWPIEEMMIEKGSDKRMQINFILENDKKIYFFATLNPYNIGASQPKQDFRKRYCGYYDKNSSEAKITSDAGFKDDILGVADFYAEGISSTGEFFRVMPPSELLSKDTEEPSPELKRLKKLIHEDDNPIIVLVK